MMHNQYAISKIADFLAVPDDKLESCLHDFFLWLSLARNAGDLKQSLSGTMLQDTSLSLDQFTWIDDGQPGATAFNVIQDGQFVVQIPASQMNTSELKNCAICGKPMDVPGDRSSKNCGGDCVACMAEAGDPACVEIMETLDASSSYCSEKEQAAPTPTQTPAADSVSQAKIQELAGLLKKVRRLGLTFERGSAYISRSYIDEQCALRQQIDTALKSV